MNVLSSKKNHLLAPIKIHNYSVLVFKKYSKIQEGVGTTFPISRQLH